MSLTIPSRFLGSAKHAALGRRDTKVHIHPQFGLYNFIEPYGMLIFAELQSGSTGKLSRQDRGQR